MKGASCLVGLPPSDKPNLYHISAIWRFRGLGDEPLRVGVIIEREGVIGRDRLTRRFHLDVARTLGKFRKVLTDFNPSRGCVIGHHVLAFDLKFLSERSIVFNLRPTAGINFDRSERTKSSTHLAAGRIGTASSSPC